METILEFMLEFVLTYIVVYLIYYFIIIRKNKQFDANHIPVEVNLILMKYKIDMNKISYPKMLYMISLLTSFNISLVITLVFYLISKNVFINIFVSLIIVVPLSMVGYSWIGKYFSKKSLEK